MTWQKGKPGHPPFPETPEEHSSSMTWRSPPWKLPWASIPWEAPEIWKGEKPPFWNADKWSTASWTGNFNVPQELKKQYGEQVSSAEGPVSIDGKGACTVTFQYKGGDKGNNKLNLAGVQLLSSKGAVSDSDFHNGSTGDSNAGNTYTVQVPSRGNLYLRYWAQTRERTDCQQGGDHLFPARAHAGGKAGTPGGRIPAGPGTLEP